jgi:hypothetical protein
VPCRRRRDASDCKAALMLEFTEDRAFVPNAVSRRFFRRNGNAQSKPKTCLFTTVEWVMGEHETPVVVAALGRAASEMIVLHHDDNRTIATHTATTLLAPGLGPMV